MDIRYNKVKISMDNQYNKLRKFPASKSGGCLLKIQWVSTFAVQKPGKAGPHLSLWCNVQAPTEFGIACNSVGYEYVAEIYFCGIRISLTKFFNKLRKKL